jgi:hypothetical protein
MMSLVWPVFREEYVSTTRIHERMTLTCQHLVLAERRSTERIKEKKCVSIFLYEKNLRHLLSFRHNNKTSKNCKLIIV